MKLSVLLINLAMGIIVSGCTSSQHIYTSEGKCITCWNNPITGEPINHDGTDVKNQTSPESQISESKPLATSGNASETPTEYQFTFIVPVNVDIAYMQIKKDLNYFTEQEIRQEWGSMADAKMQTFAYAYDSTPSVYYHMRADRNHNGIQAIIDSNIQKHSEKKSKVTITYWLRNKTVNSSNFSASLKTRLEKALNL